MNLRQLNRLIQINRTLSKHQLDEFIEAIHLLRPLRYLRLLVPSSWIKKTTLSRGERLRLALQELGPIFVKFGQLLSTRRDLIPIDIADSLAKLQDQVAPFSEQKARELMEQAYDKQPLDEIFSSIDAAPMASASIAQVHAATLVTGEDVVIKLVRPGIEKQIQQDIDLLYILAGLAEDYWSEGKRLHPREVVAELEKNLFDELDMLREAASCSQLKRNFEDSKLLYVPTVYWDYTKPNLLVQERVVGVQVSNIEALKAAGVDLGQLAAIGVEIFFTQVFRHSFFHADMHPGNVLVDISDPQHPRYAAIDFGIMGTLAPEDQRYLAENFLAFFNHDYHRVAELHIQSGWVDSNTRLDEFESAIRSVCEPIFARPLKDISFGQLLLRLFQTARRFNMQVQPQLVLLQKTLLNIEGLGRDLYPELNLWDTAKPILEEWMQEKLGWKAAVNNLKAEAPYWAETLPKLPRLMHDLNQQIQQGQLEMRLSSKDIDELRKEIRRASYRSVATMCGIGFIVAAALITGLDGYSPTMLGKLPLLSWVLGFWGLFLLFFGFSNRK